MRFTGHLDLYRAWERLIRRAALPLAYTQGFSPHPRINLASALPLGFTGQAEVVDIWLEQDIPLAEITPALRAAAPPGLEIEKVEAIDEHAPTLQAILEASQFEVILLERVDDLESKISTLLSAKELPRQRRDKNYDLRPLVFGLEKLPDSEIAQQRLSMRLSASEGATGRPEEVVAALGVEPLAARYHRVKLIFKI